MYKIHICIKNRRPLVTFRYHFCPCEKSLDIEENSVQDVCSQAENGLRDNGGPVFPARTRYFSADSREKRSPGTGLKSYKVAGIRVRSVYPRELWRKGKREAGRKYNCSVNRSRANLFDISAPDCECDFPGKSRLLD